MKDSISDDALKSLVAAGGCRDAMVTSGPSGTGWKLQVRYTDGGNFYVLRSKREPVRVFRTTDSLLRYCNGIGLKALRLEL